ncbi:MAG: hypothetical protein U5K76_15850 [Woeseiaceae bacterium]|nr:hypothetical protein [Woeseiaceae bacterium]
MDVGYYSTRASGRDVIACSVPALIERKTKEKKMRRLFSKSLDIISQIAIVLILISGLIGGWQAGGILGGVGGLIGGFIISTVIFGALFIFMDISDYTRRTAEALERQNP